ncbi:tetratricopeptide repeat protein [Spirochaetia bacterium 38H-sp]|uniref:Tetratricopeptide repeat protein n=1 Tax=Rarispira pelagica TaxID=3141764 RepID=A0ABU9UBE8_9SPIR
MNMIKKVCLSGFVFTVILPLISCSSTPDKPDGIYDTRNRAAEYLTYGWKHYNQGFYSKAEDFFLQALESNLLVDNISGVIKSYIALMQNSIAQGKKNAAEDYLARAEEWLSLTEEADVTFEYRAAKGQLLTYQGKYEEAKKILLAALSSYPDAEKKLPLKTSMVFNTLAMIEKNTGNYEKALEYANTSIEIDKKEKNFTGLASSYYIIAAVYSRKGDIAEAIENLNISLDNDKKAENSPGIANTLLALGSLYYKQEDKETAYIYYKRSLMIYLQLENNLLISKALERCINTAEEIDRKKELSWLINLREKYPTSE